jgi:hypothetical protein
MPVSHRPHRRVLGLLSPHSLHSHVGHRRHRFSLPKACRFTALRLPRPHLRRLDAAGEDFPLCHVVASPSTCWSHAAVPKAAIDHGLELAPRYATGFTRG